MSNSEKFWNIGPHSPLPVEKTFHSFVRKYGGGVVSDILPGNPSFENADYSFKNNNIIGELKEIETEFLNQENAKIKFTEMMERLLNERPNWKPSLMGGENDYPDWFKIEFIRLARPSITRILKKANKQIKETKKYFHVPNANGVLFFVNDGFTGISPFLVQALACDALTHSYSSIDCFLYITLNRYVELDGSNEPQLIWAPSYSDRADNSFVEFIDDLGRNWFNFLEEKIGGFTSRHEESDRSILLNSKAIIIPPLQN
ncbi:MULTISPECIES: hypothetical protein [Enterobacteriaceae]|uniref:hypothetical protein n=2 Tax=Enterobacteriaceae TaxID=543 RepID=UPI0005F96E42|nr:MULTISPECIES: hypothetical protein [Enterobacteriaceae]EKX4146251.1 hypothetical protein [Enterobacter cloacae]HBX1657340.1 hypothetical protein [Klebsiella quasipneumoniae subsp. similipneumoniae]EKV3654402.1 hypothetical protein [Klebsiella quasipneumoniae]KJX08050.1 hypothetical protein SG72_10995 [Enterobacter cloacae subsp. cloacae]MBD0756269.1 hypothetical protein [Klebsiella quasipneumoniae]